MAQTSETQPVHLLNTLEDVYAIYDLKSGKYDFISDGIEKLYGCNKQYFLQNKGARRSCIHQEDVAAVDKEVKDIISNKTTGEIFYRINTFSGGRKILLEKLLVVSDAAGKPDKLYIVKTDYTNVDSVEKSLMETERKFRFISENLSDFISIHDTDWNFTYASPSIKNILNYEPADVLATSGFDLIHPEDVLRAINSVQAIVIDKKETQFRYRMLSKNGTYKWVESYSKPVIDSKNEISSIISSTRDVTDQVTAENKLRESEEQYRLLSENSNDLVAIHNLQNEFVYVSPSSKQMLGYLPEELLGKRPEDVFISKEDANGPLTTAYNEVLQLKNEQKYISRVVTKTGEEKLLEVWLKPVLKDGKIVGLQSSGRDVTEREKLLGELELGLAKERELNELRQKFVSTASHQFRTPLTVIQSGVEIMDMYVDELPLEQQNKFQNQFKKIQEEVKRLESLMNDVLLLGRANAERTPCFPVKSSLTQFCQEIISSTYNNRYVEDRHVLLQTEGEDVLVNFDPKLIGHAIENIISNAYKYSTRGNILLKLIFNKNDVQIDIADEGFGIPEEDIKNLFQPFYRATNTAEIDGTGLGLSIAKEFVEMHGGKINLTSQLNKGTTVSVILPIE